MSQKKLDFVDALRGYAVLGVLLVHTALYFKNDLLPVAFKNMVAHGAMGVQLFYMASAFTLFLSLSARKSEEKHPVRNFFIRRFFRIAPLYWLAIVYFLWQNGTGVNYFSGKDGVTTDGIISHFLFFHGFNPYYINSLVPGGWSVSIEMAFYLMVPFLFTRISNIHKAFGFLALTMVLRLIFNILLRKMPGTDPEYLWEQFQFFYLPSQLPIFALGFIFFFIYKGEKLNEVSGFVSMLVLSLFAVDLFTDKSLFVPFHLKFGLLFLMFAVVLQSRPKSILVNPLVGYIGKVSYSMYLVHFCILYWMEQWDVIHWFEWSGLAGQLSGYLLKFGILVVGALGLSTITFKYLEQPAQQWGKWWIAKLEK